MATATARPTSPVTDDDPGWTTYKNTDYGFSFRYPNTWSLQEIPPDGSRSSIVQLSWETLKLVVRYRRTTENAVVDKIHPEGDRETRGAVTFLGQDLNRDTLVVDGKVKGVAYQVPGGAVQAGELVFGISLQNIGADECLHEFGLNCDYQAVDIPAALQAEVDHVVASFELIPVAPSSPDQYPGWARYSRADHGFSFRYPTTWALGEGRNFVSLRQQTLQLILGYRDVTEEVNICCRAEFPPSTVAPAGAVTFLGQRIPKALLTHGNKVKAAVYNNADRITVGKRVFLISLEDFATDYDAVDIPATSLSEADRIIASLVTFEPASDLVTPTPVPTRLPPSPVPPTPTPVTPMVVAGVDGANARSGPGTDYPRLRYLDSGTQAPVIGRYGNWWQITYNGTPAWVFADLVTPLNVDNVPQIELTPTPTAAPPTPVPATAIPTAPVIVTGVDRVNVRNGPGMAYTRIGYLDPGTQIPVVGHYGGWWQIEYDATPAWVSGQVVTAFNAEGVPEVQPLPTPTPVPPTPIPLPEMPSGEYEERWIDVDLTHQRVIAYEGQTPITITLASTGLSSTPTPVGQYRIWIKLRYDDMSGPGYYLEDVPYVMYFYQGYGFHGVWWHANFGHPMSHGCVNLPTDVAEWLFNWADVGTLVNIHD